jgi:peptidase C13-like protein
VQVRICALCLLALLLPGFVRAAAAAPARGDWKAVLVAGDNAQPVFDNAVTAITRWLLQRGVPAANIHRLSASPRADEPTVEPATARRVLQGVAGLAARPGERCFVFITSHGQRDEGVFLAYRAEFLTPAELAQALALGCGAVPSVTIVSSCYSGAFSAAPMQAPNRIVLTAARADRPSFGCQADRTYTVFDECLLASLPHAATWRATFTVNTGCVGRREKWLNVLPSQPQAFFGTKVRDLPVR